MKGGGRFSDWLLPILVLTSALLAAAVVQLGSLAAEGKLAGLDAPIRGFLVARQSPLGLTVFGAIASLGSKAVLVVIGIVAGWWLSKRSLVLVALVALCAVVSAEFVDWLKVGFEVTRPAGGIASQRSLSFPSGHVTGVASIATLLSYAAWRRTPASLRYVASLSALVIALVAVSRVYLDKHWASDTIGGALIGVALGLACSALYEWSIRLGRKEQITT